MNQSRGSFLIGQIATEKAVARIVAQNFVTVEKFHRACRTGKMEQINAALHPDDTVPVLHNRHTHKHSLDLVPLDTIMGPHLIDVPDKAGSTGLLKAAAAGHAEICEVLLDCSADINRQNYDGQTAIMLASGRGHQEVMRTLLTYRADLGIVDDLRTPAYSYAQDDDADAILKSHGATAQFTKLRTVLHGHANDIKVDSDPSNLDSAKNLVRVKRLEEKLMHHQHHQSPQRHSKGHHHPHEESKAVKSEKKHAIAALQELHTHLTHQIANSLGRDDRSLRGNLHR